MDTVLLAITAGLAVFWVAAAVVIVRGMGSLPRIWQAEPAADAAPRTGRPKSSTRWRSCTRSRPNAG